MILNNKYDRYNTFWYKPYIRYSSSNFIAYNNYDFVIFNIKSAYWIKLYMNRKYFYHICG